MSLADDAALAGALVREAGRLAQRMRAAGLEVQHKTSVSDVVTAADRAAEELVASRLAATRPEDGIVGEEGAARPSASGRVWYVDPVDGTYNFTAGLTWWCSAIALVEDDEVLVGAVYHPHEDALFVGGPELPSTCNGELLGPMADLPLDRVCAATYLHPPFYATRAGEAWTRVVEGTATLRMLGSLSMDHVAVARGVLGLSFQHTVNPWDWYPGAAIVLGAGGLAVRAPGGDVEWSVAGTPSAVAEARARLAGPDPAGR